MRMKRMSESRPIYHRSYEHAPIKAFAMLYRLAPEHEDAARWKNSLELYREYVALTSRTVPYGLLPTVYMNWTIRIFRR